MPPRAPLFLLALSFCLAAGAWAAEPFPKDAGVHSSTFKADGGLELRFGISVPEKAAKGRPLVLALHYGFDRSRPFPAGYGRSFMERVVLPGLEDLDAVILAPDSHGRSWGESEISAPVIELVKAALDAYAADPGKVVVTGYSMGGAGTWHLLAEHGELFSAGIPMAGRTSPATARKIDGVPIRAIHSVDDELIPIAPTRELIASLRSDGQPVELVEVRGITHFQSPRFAKLLRKAIPWLREQWENDDP